MFLVSAETVQLRLEEICFCPVPKKKKQKKNPRVVLLQIPETPTFGDIPEMGQRSHLGIRMLLGNKSGEKKNKTQG